MDFVFLTCLFFVMVSSAAQTQPDWEFSHLDGFNESMIEQSGTDSSDWKTIFTGTNTYFRAGQNTDKEGDTAVFSVKHQFTSSSGEMLISYYFTSVSHDGFLNVSTCSYNDTVLSIPPPNDNYMYHSSLNYECESAEDVFMTFTAVKGFSWTFIDIYRIRIFEDHSNTPAITVTGFPNMGSTTATRTTPTEVVTTNVQENNAITVTGFPNMGSTTATRTTSTEVVTTNVQEKNDSTPSQLIVLIVAVVTLIILHVQLIIAVVGCTLRYRRRKNVNLNPSPSEPRSSSQDVYYITRIQRSVPNQTHENEGDQPDLQHRLNAALNIESHEALNIRTEHSENASTGCTTAGTASQEQHVYYAFGGLPAGDEGNDPHSHIYVNDNDPHSHIYCNDNDPHSNIYSNDIDTTRTHSRPDDRSNNATTDNDDYLTSIRSHRDT